MSKKKAGSSGSLATAAGWVLVVLVFLAIVLINDSCSSWVNRGGP